MTVEPIENLLPHLQTPREYFDYLDAWTVGTVEDLEQRQSSRALVKAYLLETSQANGSRDALEALQSAKQKVAPVDDALYRLNWCGEDGDWAVVDAEDSRYPVLFTAIKSRIANQRVDAVVQDSALLDRAWFAAPMFRTLWDLVLGAFPVHRYSQVVFEYESLYEPGETSNDDLMLEQSFPRDGTDEPEDDDAQPFTERRRARIQITERIGKLSNVLPAMQQTYDPLESIVRLRVPAPQRGGHDVNFDGRFTNRSNSLTSLRQTVQLVSEIYRHSTEKAEKATWPVTSPGAVDRPMSLGAPLLVQFGEPLDLDTFDRWIASLRRKNNRFRLWGNPINRGPGKVHLYAVDNHLWQPIDLEITRDHLYALLPADTCGNTIHRLITNIQRFVDAKPRAFIGNRRYDEFLAA